MSVHDERQTELEDTVRYAKKEQNIRQYGLEYQKAALDLEIAARQMIAAILKYEIEKWHKFKNNVL